ncbi:uncharacterized protein J3D65DRAFT_624394 [Phyllosticta citribraziliensis]|uniref:Uncharacterized protein n=1 Tax=Phyllosticta citribraziliensis TaxID=989973 RepID=A0ABR1LPK9_9PEZI
MSFVARSGFRALRASPRVSPVQRRFASDVADKDASKDALRKAGKKDPELYVLWTIMAGAFGLVGYYFSRKPTSSTSENPVAKVPGSEPWNSGSQGKYQYHPGGDTTQAPREAPSALNTVIIPNVNLPKELHEKYNKWGKDGY